MNGHGTTVRNVSFTRDEYQLVLAYQAQKRIRSFSAAVGQIFQEWERLTGCSPVSPQAPVETLGADTQ